MADRKPRLGDVVDDYCSRCRLVTNHGVVGLVGEEIGRVRCTPCLHEHTYHAGKVPKRKDKVKDLFDQVLARIPGAPAGAEAVKPAAPPRRRTPHLGMRTRPTLGTGGGKGKRGRGGGR